MTTPIKRNILLNPGPSTTTDTVKAAQIVPDICPREEEFAFLMKNIRDDLVKIVHGDPETYTAVPFCGSGTICMDIVLNSLVPDSPDGTPRALVIHNGAYSERACEILDAYHIPYVDWVQSLYKPPNLAELEHILTKKNDIAVVYATHHETGSGLLNPIREIGRIAHEHDAVFITDTTSSYAMIPIDIEKDNIDFCMASAQKGIQGMTGLSYIIGRTDLIEKSKQNPTRSYYCNLYLQYEFFEKTGQMHFTPPVQTIYAARQALDEYFAEGESEKWSRHQRIINAIRAGVDRLGFRELLDRKNQSGLVSAIRYPDDPNWDFDKVHDYCYERGFTIYPGKLENTGSFRLCALGAIDAPDIENFWEVFEAALKENRVQIPAKYTEE
ncbi:MAG: 2-aminoethylphosphonate aminotransferase [Eubacterium sp.]|nr:2-aminoethylphosphonate aminotransferase [Eubacterium sp.]